MLQDFLHQFEEDTTFHAPLNRTELSASVHNSPISFRLISFRLISDVCPLSYRGKAATRFEAMGKNNGSTSGGRVACADDKMSLRVVQDVQREPLWSDVSTQLDLNVDFFNVFYY